MANQQSVETHRRYCGHNGEDGQTGRQRVEFVVHARIVVSQDDEHQHYGSQADRNGQASTKDDPGNDGRRLHQALRTIRLREA